jgi:CBS domain containing-hemolysin-like protein
VAGLVTATDAFEAIAGEDPVDERREARNVFRDALPK